MLWSVAVTSRQLWKGAVPASHTSSHANLIAVGVGVELEPAQGVTVELTLGPSTLPSQENSDLGKKAQCSRCCFSWD